MRKSGLTRRQILKAALGGLASAAVYPTLQSGGPLRAQTQSPNLVYIFADQLRACSVGCYGNEEIDTPRIDRLAAQGTRFTNAVSTSPICTPHRACLMTGRYPTVTGVLANGDRLSAGETCLAEVFLRHGYRTGYIGKWHLEGDQKPGYVPPNHRQGWTEWAGFNHGHRYFDGKY